MSWNRLIRFVDDNDVEHFGEPEIQDETELEALLEKNELWAIVYDGASPVAPLTKGDRVRVKALRPLLAPKDVPIIRCIGLNYVKHSMFSVCTLFRAMIANFRPQLRRVAGHRRRTPRSSLSPLRRLPRGTRMCLSPRSLRTEPSTTRVNW